MKARSAVLLIGLAGTLLVPPLALAQRWRPDSGPMVQAQGPGKKGEPQRGGREGRGGHEAQPPQRGERQQGRLSDEDRKGLHQDLDRASREIYKPAPRR